MMRRCPATGRDAIRFLSVSDLAPPPVVQDFEFVSRDGGEMYNYNKLMSLRGFRGVTLCDAVGQCLCQLGSKK